LSLFVIAVVAALFVFPCTINSWWFYLDDPMTLRVSRDLFSNSSWIFPDNSTGRYFPIYWLYHAVIYHMFGESPFAFFLVQSLVILASAFLIYFITLHITENKTGAVIAALLFLTGTAMPENAYTLGKAEPKALLFILLALLLLVKYISSDKPCQNPFYILFISLTMLCAMLMKEVGGLIVVTVVAGLLVTLTFKSFRHLKNKLLLLSFMLTAAVLIGRIPFLFRGPSAQNNYITYQFNFDIIYKNYEFYLFQTPDLFMLAVISLISLVICSFGSTLKLFPEQKVNIFMTFILGCSFAGCYLVWRSSLIYYAYLAYGFFSISAMSFVLLLRKRTALNIFIYASLLVFLTVTRVFSVPAFYYIASTQVAQTKLYQHLVQEYLKTEYRGSRLFIENWPSFSEQISATNLLLNNIFGRKDLKVIGLHDVLHPQIVTAEMKRLYRIDDSQQKSVDAPRTGDIVVVFSGYKPSRWSIRAISPCDNSRGTVLTKHGFQMRLVSSREIADRAFILKSLVPPLFERTNTFLGCSIYKVEKAGLLS